MPKWSSRDIPRLSGQTALVTGANSGIGYETALGLATAGALVVLACRDQTKGAEALDSLRRMAPAAQVELSSLDLADQTSVHDFAARFNAGHEGLDILVNNAGVMAIPRRETSDGFEMQFGTNHLGHFALTGLLLESLLARPYPRVVTISSEVARIGRIKFDDLQNIHHYRKWGAYAQSKLANQLFTLELDRRSTNRGIVSVAAHPGYAATNLQGVGPKMSGSRIKKTLADIENLVFAQSAAMGALPTLYAATAPAVTGAQYFGPDSLFGMRGYPKQVSFVRAAQNQETAKRLWDVSEELTGVHFESLWLKA